MTEPTDAELDRLMVLIDQLVEHAREDDRMCYDQVPSQRYQDARAKLRTSLAKWGTPPAVVGNHPYAIQWDAELGRTAMRFVDRAGDVHPGIDDAATICADFHAAMIAVIERMPHVQRMSSAPQPTQAQAGAVPLTDEMQRQMKERCDSYEMRGAFADGWSSAEAAHGIKGGQHGAE